MIKENLKNYRKLRGLTQKELAEMTGVSTGYIQMIELGKKNNPSIDLLQKLSDTLEISISDLLGIETESIKINNPIHSELMVRNEKFRDMTMDITIPYEIKLYREEKPAILSNQKGSFLMEILISTQTRDKKFKLDCRYMPSPDVRVHVVSVSLYTIFDEEDDKADPSNYYNEYANQIHPNLYEHLRTAIENAIKVYFMEIVRKPLSIDIYHNF